MSGLGLGPEGAYDKQASGEKEQQRRTNSRTRKSRFVTGQLNSLAYATWIMHLDVDSKKIDHQLTCHYNVPLFPNGFSTKLNVNQQSNFDCLWTWSLILSDFLFSSYILQINVKSLPSSSQDYDQAILFLV